MLVQILAQSPQFDQHEVQMHPTFVWKLTKHPIRIVPVFCFLRTFSFEIDHDSRQHWRWLFFAFRIVAICSCSLRSDCGWPLTGRCAIHTNSPICNHGPVIFSSWTMIETYLQFLSSSTVQTCRIVFFTRKVQGTPFIRLRKKDPQARTKVLDSWGFFLTCLMSIAPVHCFYSWSEVTMSISSPHQNIIIFLRQLIRIASNGTKKCGSTNPSPRSLPIHSQVSPPVAIQSNSSGQFCADCPIFHTFTFFYCLFLP